MQTPASPFPIGRVAVASAGVALIMMVGAAMIVLRMRAAPLDPANDWKSACIQRLLRVPPELASDDRVYRGAISLEPEAIRFDIHVEPDESVSMYLDYSHQAMTSEVVTHLPDARAWVAKLALSRAADDCRDLAAAQGVIRRQAHIPPTPPRSTCDDCDWRAHL